MWLPLAIADVVIWLMALVRMMGDDRTRRALKIPKRSEMLGAWCLPLMSEACSEDEKRYDEIQRKKRRESIGEDLMELAKKMGAKVTINE